uniref:Uncharacterized protein n=1 Tax=Arundo donax TaxID=35708 RepID=A0A0A9L1P4_ARUDO
MTLNTPLRVCYILRTITSIAIQLIN